MARFTTHGPLKFMANVITHKKEWPAEILLPIPTITIQLPLWLWGFKGVKRERVKSAEQYLPLSLEDS